MRGFSDSCACLPAPTPIFLSFPFLSFPFLLFFSFLFRCICTHVGGALGSFIFVGAGSPRRAPRDQRLFASVPHRRKSHVGGLRAPVGGDPQKGRGHRGPPRTTHPNHRIPSTTHANAGGLTAYAAQTRTNAHTRTHARTHTRTRTRTRTRERVRERACTGGG